VVVEFSVVPVGGGEELAGPIARLLDLVDRSGLPYRLTAMGTIVEGPRCRGRPGPASQDLTLPA